MKKATGFLALVIFLSSCGSSTQTTQQPPQVSVSISPSSQQSIDQGQPANFTATVKNDTSSQGVSWSLSGSACSGSACGTLTNTSTTAATYNAPASVSSALTVTVTATSVKKNTVSASATVVIAPAPAITTTSLPDGTIGTAYNATLAASGGTGNLSWTVATGSLPSGLALNGSTGVISGKPLTPGTSTFTVQVADSAPTPLSAQKQLSITVANQVMVVTTTSLSAGTVNVGYNATLQVNFATPPVTWAIATGSLPAGLSLDTSTGAITGTPTTTGTSTFTVTATDSTTPTPQTATSQPLSITINANGVNDSMLTGHYAFLLSGYDSGGKPVSVAASFVADGSGNVTSGVEDINSFASGPSANLTFAGTYAVGADNRGTITITNSLSSSYTMVVALGTVTSGVASAGTILEFDTSGYVMSGAIQQQDTSAFSTSAVNGTYAFEFTGSDSAISRWAFVGKFTASGSGSAGVISAGLYDDNDASTGPGTGTFTGGTYSISSNGRGQGTLGVATGTGPVAPATFAIYVVSSTKWLAISLDAGATSGIVTGQVKGQSGSFTAASLSGTEVVALASASGGGATNGSHVQIGTATFDGTSNLTSFSFDDEDAGTLSTQTGSGTYTVDSTGRFTITPQGGGGVVGYLRKANQGFLIDTGSDVSAGEFQGQASGPFSNSSLNGAFVIGTQPPAVPPVTPGAGGSNGSLSVGVVTFDGSVNISVTSDNNSLGTLQSDQTDSDTYSVASNGRVTLGSGSVILYILSPTSFVYMEVKANDPNPTFGIGQQ